MATNSSGRYEGEGPGYKIRNHKCAFCSRDFTRREHVLRHELTHTGNKPYSCDHCDNTFTRKDQLVRHERTLHSVEEEDAVQSSSQQKPKRRKRRPNTTTSRGRIPLMGVKDVSSISEHQVDTYDPSRFRTEPVPSMDFLPPGSFPPESGIPFLDPLLDTHSAIQQEISLPEDERIGIGDFNYIDEMQWFDTGNLDFDFLPGLPNNMVSGTPLPVSDAVQQENSQDHISHLTSSDSYRHDHESFEWETADNERDLDHTETALNNLASRLLPSSTVATSPSNMPEVSSLLFKNSEQLTPVPTISSSTRSRLLNDLQSHEHILPQGFRLPSCDALTRLVAATFNNCFHHFPFLHLPTWSAENCPTLLLLAMAALGTQYCFENSLGLSLYRVCRAIGLQQHIENGPLALERCQALLLLMLYGTWNVDKGLLREALSLQSILVQIATEDGLIESADELEAQNHQQQWHEWIHSEERRRTKFALFTFLNVQSIAYNVPPALVNNDVNLALPCNEAEWDAASPEAWRDYRATNSRSFLFQEMISHLLGDDKQEITVEILGSFASYCLIHAILQHIFYARQLSCNPGALPLYQSSALFDALKKWQRMQQRNPESLGNPRQTLIFNSDSYLRLAYSRLNVDFGSARKALQTGNPSLVALAVQKGIPFQRSKELTRAALHACIALRIPVKLGMKLVARTQVSVWNMQYLICAFEYALLLSKWLATVSPTADITSDEEILVRLVRDTLSEADMGDTKHDSIQSLPARILRVWATLFDDPAVWGIMPLMGASLRIYADMIDSVDS